MPKVAIFYDWLNQWGGAEKVLLNILRIYPQADLFSLVYDPSKTSWLPHNLKINTSFINKLPFAQHNPIFYTPFYAIALEQFDLRQYDIVISTTSTMGHALLTPPTTLFACFYHNINRHLYNNPLLSFYRPFDKLYSTRPDANLCNSITVQKRLYKYLDKHATIINPGIDTDFFIPKPTNAKKHFLYVGRLVPHKRIDVAIKACLQLKKHLVIIGTGRQLSNLKEISDPKYIHFVGQVSDNQLLEYYQSAFALICPQIEDYGLTPIEAMSCGIPVIALNKGGIPETVIHNKTGILFDNQTVLSAKSAIITFQKKSFNHQAIRKHALKYSDTSFMLNFKKEINRLWNKHQNI